MADTNIARTSRYYDGPILQLPNAFNPTLYDISVYRNWPDNFEFNYKLYTWTEGDNLPALAYKNPTLQDPTLWCVIMDIHPEIDDPFSIEPGQQIRVPA